MNQIETLTQQLSASPETVNFQDVIKVIDKNYLYTPSHFTNGPIENPIVNAPGENEGSCKIFSFAKINNLDTTQTLNCFGDYYRTDVLQNPDNIDHANIRTFIKHGWDNINFENIALKLKE